MTWIFECKSCCVITKNRIIQKVFDGSHNLNITHWLDDVDSRTTNKCRLLTYKNPQKLNSWNGISSPRLKLPRRMRLLVVVMYSTFPTLSFRSLEFWTPISFARTRAPYSSAEPPNTRYPHSNFTAYVVAFLDIANFTNVAITAVLFKYLQSLSYGCIDK